MSDKFISNRLTFIVLASACTVILVSMELRQTFGLFLKPLKKVWVFLELNLVWRLGYR